MGEREMSTAERPIRYRRGAKALAVRDGAALLVKERHCDGTPFWTLPGGGIDPGESAPEALRRELEEELACRGTVGDDVGWFAYAHCSSPTVSVYTVFRCDLEGSITPEITECVFDHIWAPPSQLPTCTLPQVRLIFEGAHNPLA